MIIRQFRDSDAQDVSDLIILCLKKVNSKFYPETVIESIIKEQTPENVRERSQNHLVLVADQYDDIIGTATVNFDSRFFGSVFVHPDYHGQGIGKKLMINIEKLVSQQGINKVKIHASINAVKFYERLGYIRLGLVEDNIFGKSYKMKKSI